MAVYAIEDGDVLAGELPRKEHKLVVAMDETGSQDERLDAILISDSRVKSNPSEQPKVKYNTDNTYDPYRGGTNNVESDVSRVSAPCRSLSG